MLATVAGDVESQGGRVMATTRTNPMVRLRLLHGLTPLLHGYLEDEIPRAARIIGPSPDARGEVLRSVAAVLRELASGLDAEADRP